MTISHGTASSERTNRGGIASTARHTPLAVSFSSTSTVKGTCLSAREPRGEQAPLAGRGQEEGGDGPRQSLV
jgi:hypothetical protein